MDALNISVTDENMKLAIDSWEDGAEYELRVRQTAPGQFELVSAETAKAEPEAEEEESMPPKAPMPMMESGAKAPVDKVIAAGKKSARV